GPASFDYTVRDNGTTNGADDFKSDTGSVSITVTEVNDPPVASDDIRGPDRKSTRLNSSDLGITYDVSGVQTKERSQSLPVPAATPTSITHGTLAPTAGTVSPYPTLIRSGPASFDYTVRDNGTTNGADDFKSDTGSVSITVTEVNDPPVASDDIRG